MRSQSLLSLVKKYPQLSNSLTQGHFLMGYTNGSEKGKVASIFLLRSPWAKFCISALAGGSLPAGGVIVVTDEDQLSPQGNWQAYSLES